MKPLFLALVAMSLVSPAAFATEVILNPPGIGKITEETLVCKSKADIEKELEAIFKRDHKDITVYLAKRVAKGDCHFASNISVSIVKRDSVLICVRPMNDDTGCLWTPSVEIR